MTLASNAKLARLARKKLLPWDIKLLRAISVGRGEWSDFVNDKRYEDALDRLVDWDLTKLVDEKYVLTPAGKLVLDAQDDHRM